DIILPCTFTNKRTFSMVSFDFNCISSTHVTSLVETGKACPRKWCKEGALVYKNFQFADVVNTLLTHIIIPSIIAKITLKLGIKSHCANKICTGTFMFTSKFIHKLMFCFLRGQLFYSI
ncbi:hypothetical protein R6Q59_019878, partial [Mikania micrantha]